LAFNAQMPTTDDEFRSAISAILEIFDSAPEWSARPADHKRAAIAFAWTQKTLSLARAVLILTDAGAGHEAESLARQVLEFTVQTHWLAVGTNARAEAVMTNYQRSMANLDVDRATSKFPLPSEAFQEVAAAEFDPKGESFGSFKTVCESLGVEDLYVMYRILSSGMHPGWPAAQAFLAIDGDEENSSTFLLRQTAVREQTPALGMTAVCLVWLGRGLDSLMPTKPFKAPLIAMAKRLRMRVRILPIG
jgi:hypothetical protein